MQPLFKTGILFLSIVHMHSYSCFNGSLIIKVSEAIIKRKFAALNFLQTQLTSQDKNVFDGNWLLKAWRTMHWF